MRLFIGVELPDSIREAAVEAMERLRARLLVASPRVALRWVTPPNLHITVWFLGYLADDRRGPLVERLQPAFEVSRFSLRLSDAGAFPPSGPPRALWLGVGAGGDALHAIHRQLADRLHRLGFEPERRPYAPHLTVARLKDVGRADAVALRQTLRDIEVAPAAADIGHVTLFRSEPSAGGSRYTSVLRVPLS